MSFCCYIDALGLPCEEKPTYALFGPDAPYDETHACVSHTEALRTDDDRVCHLATGRPTVAARVE